MAASTFKQIAEFSYSAQAHILKAKLESANIEVFLRDSHTIDADPLMSQAIGGVKLFVHTQNYDQAREILTDIKLFAVSEEAPLCPNCHKERRTVGLRGILSELFPFFAKSAKCRECNAPLNT